MSDQVDNYQSWMARMMGGRGAKPVEAGESVKTSAGEPFEPMEFVRMPRQQYIGEVGKKNGDYIFHFFPKEGEQFPEGFAEDMGDAFIEVFRLEDRIQAVYSEELNSWAVKAVGFASNPLSDTLALRLFAILDKYLSA